MLTLIIPVYKNEESIDDLLITVEHLFNQISDEIEAVFVVDGSPDRCYEKLKEKLPEYEFSYQLVLLSRNFGSFSAIRAGLKIGNGDYFAIMAADLQEPPELVMAMYKSLTEHETDIVIGTRESRNDPFLTRVPADIFWWLYRRYVVSEVPAGGVDVFACNRKFRNTLLKMKESHSSLIAQVFWLGFRRKNINYIRQKRKYGKSAWTFQKKVNYLLDSVFAFTDLPIKILIKVGLTGILIAMILGIAVGLGRAIGIINVPGYTMTVIVIMFFGALNLFSLGLVGSYAWRAYENTKRRPLAVILESHKRPRKKE